MSPLAGLLKSFLLGGLILFVLPLSLRTALYFAAYDTPVSYSYDSEIADMSSCGLLPSAAELAEARVLIFSVPLSGRRGQFLSHHWVVFKREKATSWSRYEVLGFASRDGNGLRNGAWLGNKPTLNRYAPDSHWFGRTPVIIADVNGAAAAAVIGKIENAIDEYEVTSGRYRFWPGPNSNTFIAAIIRAAPELATTLPPTAIGKDFRPGLFLGLTDSRTGIEANAFGVLGFKVGWIEGVELNLLGFVAGFDIRHPALKLPGFGRLDFSSFAF